MIKLGRKIEQYIRARDANGMCLDLVLKGRKNCTDIASRGEKTKCYLRRIPKGKIFVASKPKRENSYNPLTERNEPHSEFQVGWNCLVGDIVSLEELVNVGVPKRNAAKVYNQWKGTNLVSFLSSPVRRRKERSSSVAFSPSVIAKSALCGFGYSFRPCCIRWQVWRLSHPRLFFERPLPTLFNIWELLKEPYCVLLGAIRLNKRGFGECARLIKEGRW